MSLSSKKRPRKSEKETNAKEPRRWVFWSHCYRAWLAACKHWALLQSMRYRSHLRVVLEHNRIKWTATKHSILQCTAVLLLLQCIPCESWVGMQQNRVNCYRKKNMRGKTTKLSARGIDPATDICYFAYCTSPICNTYQSLASPCCALTIGQDQVKAWAGMRANVSADPQRRVGRATEYPCVPSSTKIDTHQCGRTKVRCQRSQPSSKWYSSTVTLVSVLPGRGEGGNRGGEGEGGVVGSWDMLGQWSRHLMAPS